jgi:hypothetical protein
MAITVTALLREDYHEPDMCQVLLTLPLTLK